MCPAVASVHAQEESDARGWGYPGALPCPAPDQDGAMAQALPCHPSRTPGGPKPCGSAGLGCPLTEMASGTRFLRCEVV